jgi:hypothetical protein
MTLRNETKLDPSSFSKLHAAKSRGNIYIIYESTEFIYDILKFFVHELTVFHY